MKRRFTTSRNLFNNVSFGSLLFLSALLSLQTAVFSQSLDWLDKISVFYPSELYLTALGVGDTKEAADNSAYNGISRIFKIDIFSESEQRQSYSQLDGGQERSQFDSDEKIQVRTDNILENVKIERHGFDSGSGQFYSLAVLRKKEFAAILVSRLEELGHQMERDVSYRELEESKFLKFKSLLRCRLIAMEMEQVYDKLKIVYDGFSDHAPEVSPGDVERRIREFTIKDFKIGIHLDGEMADDLESILMEALSQQSIYVTRESAEGSDLLFEGELKLRERPGRTDRRFYTVSWFFSLKLKDMESGRAIFSDNIRGEQSHNTFEMAKDRILYKFETEKVQEIIEKINAVLYES